MMHRRNCHWSLLFLFSFNTFLSLTSCVMVINVYFVRPYARILICLALPLRDLINWYIWCRAENTIGMYCSCLASINIWVWLIQGICLHLIRVSCDDIAANIAQLCRCVDYLWVCCTPVRAYFIFVLTAMMCVCSFKSSVCWRERGREDLRYHLSLI